MSEHETNALHEARVKWLQEKATPEELNAGNDIYLTETAFGAHLDRVTTSPANMAPLGLFNDNLRLPTLNEVEHYSEEKGIHIVQAFHEIAKNGISTLEIDEDDFFENPVKVESVVHLSEKPPRGIDVLSSSRDEDNLVTIEYSGEQYLMNMNDFYREGHLIRRPDESTSPEQIEAILNRMEENGVEIPAALKGEAPAEGLKADQPAEELKADQPPIMS